MDFKHTKQIQAFLKWRKRKQKEKESDADFFDDITDDATDTVASQEYADIQRLV